MQLNWTLQNSAVPSLWAKTQWIIHFSISAAVLFVFLNNYPNRLSFCPCISGHGSCHIICRLPCCFFNNCSLLGYPFDSLKQKCLHPGPLLSPLPSPFPHTPSQNTTASICILTWHKDTFFLELFDQVLLEQWRNVLCCGLQTVFPERRVRRRRRKRAEGGNRGGSRKPRWGGKEYERRGGVGLERRKRRWDEITVILELHEGELMVVYWEMVVSITDPQSDGLSARPSGSPSSCLYTWLTIL